LPRAWPSGRGAFFRRGHWAVRPSLVGAVSVVGSHLDDPADSLARHLSERSQIILAKC
jgi:hypothetical protein